MNIPQNVGWFVFGLVCIFGIASAGVEPRAHAEEVTPEYRLMQRYKQGNLSEAREELRSYVKSSLKYIKTHNSSKRMDFEVIMGTGSNTANLVAACLEIERKRGKGNVIPSKVWKIVEMAEQAADLALAKGKKTPSAVRKKVNRYEQSMQYTRKQKANLLVEKIVSLEAVGKGSRAMQLIKKHEEFIKSHADRPHEAKIDDELRSGLQGADAERTGGQDETENQEVVSGRSLRILKLVISFYEALSKEDAEALDKHLLKGKNLMTGKDIVEEISVEREAEQDFDAIGPANFDSKSTLTVKPRDGDRFQVKVDGVLKTFRKGGETFTRRESDLFMIQKTNGDYKLVFPAGKGMHR